MKTWTGNPWLTFFKPNPSANVRLFCFPYAGAGASVYWPWASALPPEIEVVGIQYPGRETRVSVPMFRSLTDMVESLMEAIIPALDRPFLFFGHSMGSLVSFELTRALAARGCFRPEHVFFSGAGAPHTTPPPPIHHLRDAEFLTQVARLNGIPKDVLRDPVLIRYMLPILRADFTMCESYRYQIGAPLQCGVSAFGGELDPRVDKQRLCAWADHASMYFSSAFFPGDHFFIRTAQAAVIDALLYEVQSLIAAAAAA